MQRFWDKVKKTSTCWLWTGASRGATGYGAFKLNGKVVDTHRVSYMIHFGYIMECFYVCHKCDNRLCVNPKHLFLGTQVDNMQDCKRKGRLAKFTPEIIEKLRKVSREQMLNAALTIEQAKEVKVLLSEGNRQCEIARQFNVSRFVISRIKRGECYDWI
jgi:hypothetical protein